MRGAALKIVGTAGGILSGVVVLLVLLVAVGGGVYRTDCIDAGGKISHHWWPEGDIPYLWHAGDGCQSHTLMRYVLGEVGVATKLDSSDYAYTPRLLADIGRGDHDYVGFFTSLRGLNASEPLNSAQSQDEFVALFRGQLSRLSLLQLSVMSRNIREAKAELPRAAREVSQFGVRLASDEIPAAETRNVVVGSRLLADDWNTELRTASRGLRFYADVFMHFGGQYDRLGRLVDAAASAKASGSLTAFTALRVRVIHEYLPMVLRLRAAARRLSALGDEAALRALVASDPAARALAKQEATRYPGGILNPGAQA